MSYELFIAKRYLRSKRKSRFVSVITLISAGGVLIGVAALIIVLSVMNGFESEVRSRIIGTTAHITVSTFQKEGLTDYKRLLTEIESVPGVVAASPTIQYKAAIASNSAADGIVLRGIDPELESRVTDLKRNMVYGDLSFEAVGGPGMILGRDLADHLGVTVGEQLTVFSLREPEIAVTGLMPKVSRFVTSGLFQTGMYEYDATLAYISLDDAQKLFNMGQTISTIEVKIDDIYSARRLAREVEQKIGYPYYAMDWMSLHKNLFSWMTLEKWAMFLTLSLIVAVAAFNIISALIMAVTEKRKDIGILKSMGATSGGIMRIFVLQGIAAGVVGTVLGGFLGLSLCYLQEKFRLISLPPEIYFISSLPVQVKVIDVLLVSLATLALTLLATIYPARKAASLSPVEVIRYE
jgi:lipoprotein-releasing system permease protein